jgi:hypothetical protein
MCGKRRLPSQPFRWPWNGTMMRERLRIIVLGYLVRGPFGGMAWHHLQYVLGLHRLGHDVYFVEDSDDYPSCYDPDRGVMDTDPSYGLRFAGDAFARLGLTDRWAYYDAFTERWLGPGADQTREVFASADLLLNLSGVNPLRPWLMNVPIRVLLDTDPVFTQVRHLLDAAALERARCHTHFCTFGENIEQGTATVPNDGLPWRATRQPVVLDAWVVTPGPERAPFTTVMQWDSYPAREYRGRRYGMKADSFEPYVDLPARVDCELELALGSPSAPRTQLAERGWILRDPLEVTKDPWTYQRYIRASKAEFSLAKHGYVVSHSGWFSERSAAYLASGRPVVVQDTGFTDWLPSEAGVLAFRTPAEARDRIREVSGAYRHHCQAARDVAERYFDSRRVLPLLLESALTGGG